MSVNELIPNSVLINVGKLNLHVRFTNLTPHDINIFNYEDELIHTIPASGDVVRLNTSEETLFYLGDIEVNQVTYMSADDLAPYVQNHYYIVSALVANAYPDRRDFLMVHKTVRDDDGRIIGCRAFAQA